MSNKSNIVISAADGCGKPSSIRSMDNSHRNHKGAEYKESFMFSKFLSNSHGSSMAAKVAIAGSALVVFATASAASFGSVITWGTATNISGPSDVSTVGSLVIADAFGCPTQTEIVNGVTFNAFTADNGQPVAVQGNVTISTPVSGDTMGYNLNIGGGTNFGASYNGILDQAATLVGTGSDPMDLAVTGLASGQLYQIEIWVADYRVGGSNNRSETLSGSTSDSATIEYLGGNGTGTSGGQFITGTFVADNSGTQTISMTPAPVTGGGYGMDAQINAFQLRTVPEPATLGLVAVGGLGLLLLKRRKAV
ncbi:MAG: PEP-CTERM sorting domain-containing protein [Planctomycetes bacterium]|jgi:hypothetical protein|nr:PEP-CTERM sorting domain-containing protein [Planctomycetota bacterium]